MTGTQTNGALRVGAALVSLLVLTACSNSGVVEQVQQSRTVAARSGSADGVIGTPGNPPFYEVHGRRYRVLPTADGYRERGIASWYGPKFHGKSTSGGEIYDMNAMTAAHKTLPIPTWVEVTNLANNRRVIVRVNDRGPFVDNRIIDLSYRAAKELDMIGTGTARVQVRALGAPAAGGATAPAAVIADRGAGNVGAVGGGAAGSSAARSDAAGSRDSGTGFSLISAANAAEVRPDDGLYVQVGAFSDRDNAIGLVSKLKHSGYANTFVLGGGRDNLYRVRIGPLADVSEFDAVRARLRGLGVADARLVTNEL